MYTVLVWDWDCEDYFISFNGTEADCENFISQNGLCKLAIREKSIYCE